MVKARLKGLPPSVRMVVQDTDAVIRWCTLALVKSGTVTLQVAKQLKPMVAFYTKANPFFYLVARAVLSTKFFSLPNVIAMKRIVPELIPHWGGAEPLVAEAQRLLQDPAKVEKQRRDLLDILTLFEGKHAAGLAADAIEDVAGLATSHERQGRIPDALKGPRTRSAEELGRRTS
jgi:lipid-A-disaccharide synthase